MLYQLNYIHHVKPALPERAANIQINFDLQIYSGFFWITRVYEKGHPNNSGSLLFLLKTIRQFPVLRGA